MTWINPNWIFRKKESKKHLINALIEAVEEHPNDQALGAIVRNFCNDLRNRNTFNEKKMYKLLNERSKKYNHKP